MGSLAGLLLGLPEGWDVATSLDARPGGADHDFVAADYDALVDHPVELGRFARSRFDVAGVAHEIVVAGALPDFDGERFAADVARICATELRFWHGDGRPPFERYVFLLNAVEDGRGGLEHRSSTALVASRRDLPRRDAVAVLGPVLVVLRRALGVAVHAAEPPGPHVALERLQEPVGPGVATRSATATG